MKHFIFLLFTIITTSASLAQIKRSLPNDIPHDNDIDYLTKISSVEVISYKTQIGFNNLDSIGKKEFIQKKEFLSFDENENLIEYKKSDFTYGGSKIQEKYRYDNEHQLIEIISKNQYNNTKTVYEYEEGSENINRIDYDYSISKRNYKTKHRAYVMYGINNNNVHEVKSIGDYGRVSKDIYKFDSNGNVIYSETRGIITKTKYTYDSKGNVIKEYTTNNNNKGGYSKHKYNTNNKLIETISYELNDKLFTKLVLKYLNGVIIHEILYYYKNNKISGKREIKYQLDNIGNWTRKEFFKDDISYELITRKIKYRS